MHGTDWIGTVFFFVYVKVKDRKRSLSGKTTTTRCGIRETATTRHFVLWLSKEMTTTSSNFMKTPQTAEAVAYHLMDIFCMFGAPFILQSYNGHEFANKIIQNLADMWPGMKLNAWKAETFSKSRISWKIQPRCSRHAGYLDVRQQHKNLVWRTSVYPKQETLRSAFSHQDKPLWGYVWNGAEDPTWEFSAHWGHVLFSWNWRTGTALYCRNE